MLTAIIIEDERNTREFLEKLILRHFSDKMVVLDAVESVSKGVEAIKKYKTALDVVFLDIQMPEENGYKLFNYITDVTFEVVFTTAFKDYAIDAIKLSAFDYLLKTINLIAFIILGLGLIGCKNNSEPIPSYAKTHDIAQSTNAITSPIETSSDQNYCSLTLAKTFDYLTENSPFDLGSAGSVNFTKRFDYSRNAWVEGEINISGGMSSNSRLSGKYQVTNRNTLKVFELRTTGGSFDASRNGDTYGSFKINCDGNIEGYLRDYNGNTKDVTFLKN